MRDKTGKKKKPKEGDAEQEKMRKCSLHFIRSLSHSSLSHAPLSCWGRGEKAAAWRKKLLLTRQVGGGASEIAPHNERKSESPTLRKTKTVAYKTAAKRHLQYYGISNGTK